MSRWTLAKAYGGRFGPGKVHAVLNMPYTECGIAPHAEYVEGEYSEVTCKRCLRRHS